MLEVSEAESAALREQAEMAGTDGLTRIMEVFAIAEMGLREAVSKKILVEVTLLKAMEARNAVSLDAVLEQLRNLREEKGGEVVSIPLPAKAPGLEAKPFRAQTSTPVSGAAAAPAEVREQPGGALSSNLRELWVSLVEAVGRVSPFARTYLLEAHPVS